MNQIKRKLTYYQYFLLSDLRVFREIWLKLTGRELHAAANSFSFVSTAAVLVEQHPTTWGIYSVYSCGSFLILEISREAGITFSEMLEELETLVRQPLAFSEDFKIGFGETIILISDQWEDLPETEPRDEISTNTLFGPLKFIKTLDEERRHVYALNNSLMTPENQNDLINLIRHFDKQVFIHNTKMRYLRQRTHLINMEADKNALMVSNILHNRFIAQVAQSPAEVMEAKIEQLALNYGVIASYFRLMQESQGLLERSQSRVTTAARNIYGNTLESNLQEYLAVCRKTAGDVQHASDRVNLIMNEVKAAIDVVQTQVDLMRSKESVELQRQFNLVLTQNVDLQRKSLTLQVAAGFVEFIVIAYYSLSIWKSLSDSNIFHHIPAILTLIIAGSFAGLAVFGTHLLAHEHRSFKQIALATCGILILLTLMAVLSSGLIFN